MLLESSPPTLEINVFCEVACPELLPYKVIPLLDPNDGLYRVDQHPLNKL